MTQPFPPDPLSGIESIPPQFGRPDAILSLIEAVSSGIVMIDTDGVIVLVNAEMERMFGYTREELIGRTVEMLLPERLHSAYERHRQAYLENPIRRALGAGREFFGCHKDGHEFPVEIGLSNIESDRGPLAVASVVDISARLDTSIRQLFEHELSTATARLKQLSLYDSLTGLPNRVLLFDRLDQVLLAAKRTRTGFALMMIDLNLFKDVNDTLGHAAGDALLADIGRRLQGLSRASDTLARIGGDEFAAVLSGCDTPQSAVVVANKIHAALNEPLTVEGQTVRVSAAIGVAFFPEHGDDPRALLAHADQAMYVAKKSSRICEIYTPDGSASRTLLIACNLSEALAHAELYLEYQPKMRLTTGTLVGVEALVRWRHPDLGSIPPGEFIGVAERTAIIKPITYAILEMALDQAARWGGKIPIAVNLSARMVDNGDLTTRTLAALSARGLSPTLLTYEVTETALMASPLRVQESLRSLREAGINISIDDFGAGYTSLKYLRDFVISEIKIDRMFVTGLIAGSRDVAIVRSIATLGRGFEVKIVAEGIEHLEQLPLLIELGCEYGQGYALGRPMPAEMFESWRASRHL